MVSVASFVVLSMAIWALLTTLVEFGARNTYYCPRIFDTALGCFADSADFLHLRYTQSTQTFVLAAGLTLALLLYLVVMLVPSVLAEIKSRVERRRTWGAGSAAATGTWRRRSPCWRWRACSWPALWACCCCWRASASWRKTCSAKPPSNGSRRCPKACSSRWCSARPRRRRRSRPLAACCRATCRGCACRWTWRWTSTTTFASFPRQAIPRARIFSRYVALLEHLAAQGCDRIVIVAHSQGTVVSAELLRYLQHRAQRQADAGIDDRVTRLWPLLQGKVELLTAGCPLRQLYAARFPVLYAWVDPDRGAGPQRPAGRRCRREPLDQPLHHGRLRGTLAVCDPPPALDTVGGRATLCDPAPGPASTAARTVAPMARAERDVCLGSGAHTHYFEQGGTHAARWIDSLVG
jgi:hypothetical protein